MRVTVPGAGSGRERISFTFGTRRIGAVPGESYAAALTANGVVGLRDAADGDVRGVFCGMGVCGECAITVDGRSGVLACMTPVTEGAVAGRQPPHAPLADAVPPGPAADVSCDVLVIGGGPAGLSAATLLARSGLDVVLVDERTKPGGQFYKQPVDGEGLTEADLDRQFRAGRRMIADAERSGATILDRTMVWAAPSPRRLLAVGPLGGFAIESDHLVIAAGAYERGVPFPGWTLPGVMTTGAAQTLLRSYQVAPGRRVLVAGNGPLNMQVAAELARTDVEVVGLVEAADLRWTRNLGAGGVMAVSRPGLVRTGMMYRAALERRRVPVVDRSVVVRAEGDERVTSIDVARIDADGRAIPNSAQSFDVDAVCLGYGFESSNAVARAIGCPHQVDERTRRLEAVRSSTGATPVDGVWIIGDSGGIRGAYNAASQGTLAAAEIIARARPARVVDLRGRVRAAAQEWRRNDRFQRALADLYATPLLSTQFCDDGTVVCRCEVVPWATIESAATPWSGSAGAVKRITRAGMGVCQGRYCGPLVSDLAAAVTSVAVGERSGFAPQAPIRPVTIGSIVSDAPSETTNAPRTDQPADGARQVDGTDHTLIDESVVDESIIQNVREGTT